MDLPSILKNEGVSGRHWVSFELAGVQSNRMALNARVRIVAGGVTQTDEIHSGGSYLSQNDTRSPLRTRQRDENRQRRDSSGRQERRTR